MNDVVTRLQVLEQRLTVMQQEVNEVLGQLVDTTNSMRKLQIEFARYIDNRVTLLETRDGKQSSMSAAGSELASTAEENQTNGESVK